MQSLSYLGVVEAIPLVRSSLGSLCHEEELTVCFVKETEFPPSKKLTNTNAAFTIINPLTPIRDQERISPYNISTISSRQVMRIKKNLN